MNQDQPCFAVPVNTVCQFCKQPTVHLGLPIHQDQEMIYCCLLCYYALQADWSTFCETANYGTALQDRIKKIREQAPKPPTEQGNDAN